MEGLSLTLLGTFSAEFDGKTLDIRSHRGQALLVYLATEQALGANSHQREKLMELLWPEMTQQSAQANLRQVLYLLRQAIPAVTMSEQTMPVRLFRADRQTVSLNPQYRLYSDLRKFFALLEQPQECWPEAIKLYRDDFLAGFFLPASNVFEEWVASRRAAFQRKAVSCLDHLAQEALDKGCTIDAEYYARRNLSCNSLHESAHHQLIQALDANGQRNEALAQYSKLERLLMTELGVEPMAELQEFYRQLRDTHSTPLQLSKESEDTFPLRPPRAVGPCPYRGLAGFREQDAPFFFGREDFVSQLAAGFNQTSSPHLLIGPSGSGKSSVVHAGLLPKLREEGWLITCARPGRQPFDATAAALLSLLEPDLSEASHLIETRKLGGAMTSGEVTLHDVAARVLENNADNHRVLLFLDQFEELFTLCREESLRYRFQNEITATVLAYDQQPARSLVILIAMRADFMSQVLSHRPLADAVQNSITIIGPMTDSELWEAIEEPAIKQGAAFEEGLVARILKDVGREPGYLPLLEFTLTLLWEKQDDGWLTHDSYNKIGQIEGALTGYADNVLTELAETEREMARHIFVQLVQPGQGTEDTRRMAVRAEINDTHWPVVQHLANYRLVTTSRDDGSGQERVDLVHEALIQQWSQLRSWMSADRAFRNWQERLRSSLRGWQASGSDVGALLRGGPLAEAEDWLAERPGQVSITEQEFIESSIELRIRREMEREAHQNQELEAANRLTRLQSRAATRLRKRAYFLAGAGIVAVILALLALFSGNRASQERLRAEQQTDLALSRELAGAALTTLSQDSQLSVLLALEAVSKAETTEAMNALHHSLSRLHIPYELPGDIGSVLDLALSSDGNLLAAATEQGVVVWDALALTDPYTIAEDESVWSVSFGLDSSILAIGTNLGEVQLWDAASQQWLRSFGPAASASSLVALPITSLAFSKDSKTLVAGSLNGFARIWEIESGQLLLTVGGSEHHRAEPIDTRPFRFKLALSPAGNTLVSGGRNGQLFLWDVSTGDDLLRLGEAGQGWINAVAFDPNGSTLAAATNRGKVWLWDYSENLQEIVLSSSLDEEAFALAFSHDGTKLATIGDQGVTNVWDVETGQLLASFIGPPGVGNSLTFNLDDSKLYIGGSFQHLQAWTLEPGRELLTLEGSGFWDLDISPNGFLLATVGESAIIWDLQSGQKRLVLPIQEPWRVEFGHESDILLVAHAVPEGRIPSLGHRTSSLGMWNVDSGAKLMEVPSFWSYVYDMAFSPDGREIAVSTSGYRPCQTQLFHARTGDYLNDLEEQEDCDIGLEFAANSGILLTASQSGIITSWDAGSAHALDELPVAGTFQYVDYVRTLPSGSPAFVTRQAGTITSFTISADGQQMAVGTASGTILVRSSDLNSGSRWQTLAGHTSQIWALDFSPDGKHLASASLDRTVRVWALAEPLKSESGISMERSSQEFLRFTSHTDYVMDVAFTPDGNRLVSASLDGTVRVYTLVLEELVELAQSRLARSLTTEECQRYLHLDSCPERED